MPDKSLTPEEVARNKNALRFVKPWLRFRQVTQRRLADDLGMSEPSISKWLRGEQAITMAQFTRIAEILNAKPHELLFDPPDRERADRYQRIAAAVDGLSDAQLNALALIIETMKKD